jgi:hypothetical protein
MGFWLCVTGLGALPINLSALEIRLESANLVKRLNSLEQRVAHYSYFLAASYAHSIPLIPKLSLDNVKGFFTCLAVFGLFVL